MPEARVARLYSLDAARAIAALAVVFQHWEHFLAVPAFAAAKTDSPLYWLFLPFYEKGARAVTFFFCLSGFVFYWLYSEKVHRRAVGPATFAVLRLSRLYPLHLATLLMVAALQGVLIGMLGRPFIYQQNDAGQLMLNLFLIQSWATLDTPSFNGPSWSISIEAFLYLAFFLACLLTRPSARQCAALALIGLVLARYSPLANAAVPFFFGGLSFRLYRQLSARWTGPRHAVLIAGVLSLWALGPLVSLGTLPESLRGTGEARFVAPVLSLLTNRFFDCLLFPATVLALALSETVWRRIPWRTLHGFGDMSYSIYLLHFPLQAAFVAIALALHFPGDFFLRISTLTLFMAGLLAVSFASYRWFEKPTMDAIRKLWFSRRFAAPADGEAPAPVSPEAARRQA